MMHDERLPCPPATVYVYGTTTYVRAVGQTDYYTGHLIGHGLDLAGLYSAPQ